MQWRCFTPCCCFATWVMWWVVPVKDWAELFIVFAVLSRAALQQVSWQQQQSLCLSPLCSPTQAGSNRDPPASHAGYRCFKSAGTLTGTGWLFRGARVEVKEHSRLHMRFIMNDIWSVLGCWSSTHKADVITCKILCEPQQKYDLKHYC